MPRSMTAVIESMEVIPKEDWEEKESKVAIGMDNGIVTFVEVGVGRKGRRARVIDGVMVRHDELEGVVGLGFVDDGQRLVTGGGAMVKVWDEEDGQEEDDDDEDDDVDEDDEDEDKAMASTGRKRRNGVPENIFEKGSNRSDDDEDDDEDFRRPRKKKRKRSKNKGAATNQVLRFKGLD